MLPPTVFTPTVGGQDFRPCDGDHTFKINVCNICVFQELHNQDRRVVIDEFAISLVIASNSDAIFSIAKAEMAESVLNF